MFQRTHIIFRKSYSSYFAKVTKIIMIIKQKKISRLKFLELMIKYNLQNAVSCQVL